MTQSTAYGRLGQPHSVASPGYGSEVIKKTDSRRVLWQNVSALMRSRYGKEHLTKFAEDIGAGPGTATRIKNQETSVGLEVIDRIAREFKLEAWQLFVPDLDPTNPPVLAPLTDSERRLYAKLRETVEVVGGLVREQGGPSPKTAAP